jgi:hypothetical protein
VSGHLAAAKQADPAEVAAHFHAAAARFGAAGQPVDAQRCARLAQRHARQ